MKLRFKLLLLLLLLTFFVFSQTTFKKGVIITNLDQRIECQIKSEDWKNNPTEFQYKLSENSEVKTQNIENTKSFEIFGVSKYIKATVDIDRSKNIASELSNNRSPIFKEETLFLQVLIEGKATLYGYSDINLNRYFYKLNDESITQLIHKEFLYDGNNIGVNNYYRQQLLTNLECESISEKEYENLKYTKRSLSKFFEKYNFCKGDSETLNYTNKQKRDFFNLRAKIGYGLSSLEVLNRVNNSRNVKFESGSTFRFGAEIEMILPFNNDKWAIVVDPYYQTYSSETERSINNNATMDRDLSVKVDYASFEIPLGVRHYFFLNEDSRIFVNAFYSIGLENDSQIEYASASNVDITRSSSAAFGVGFAHKRLAAEFRYEFPKNILLNYVHFDSELKQFYFMVSYQLF